MTVPIHVNNAQTTFGADHAVDDGTLVMAAGYGTHLAAKLAALGLTLDANNPLRVTAIKRTALNTSGQITDLTKLTIFEVTGRTTDTLTGATVVEGTSDQAFAEGDTLAVLWTAGAAKELRAAIGGGASTLDELTDVVITSPQPSDLLAYDSGSGTWINSNAIATIVYANQNDILDLETSVDTLGGDLVTHAQNTSNPHSTTYTQVGAAAASHAHAAGDITSGTLSVAQGGTGATTFASGAVLVGAGTSAVTSFGAVSGTTLSLGTASGGNGTIESTSHATKGRQYINTSTCFVEPWGGFVSQGAAANQPAFVMNGPALGAFSASYATARFVAYPTHAQQITFESTSSAGTVFVAYNSNGGGGAGSLAISCGYNANTAAFLASGFKLGASVNPGLTAAGRIDATAASAGEKILVTTGVDAQTGKHWTLRGRSSTTEGQTMGSVDVTWSVSTHASRLSVLTLSTDGYNGPHAAIKFQDTGSIVDVVVPIANVRNAADDAAAAALSPAVPVGGVYRNGSVLMIRAS